MGRSKINFGDETLIDLTGDSVTPEAMLSGVTAHNAAGDPIKGTLVPGDMTAAVYDPRGKAQDIFAYAAEQAGAAMDAATAAASAASRAQSAASRAQSVAESKLSSTGNARNLVCDISVYSQRKNLVAGEKLSSMFGKIYRYFADLKALAFKASVEKADLADDVPLLPDVTVADNGKFLRVVSGAWAAATVDNANGVSF